MPVIAKIKILIFIRIFLLRLKYIKIEIFVKISRNWLNINYAFKNYLNNFILRSFWLFLKRFIKDPAIAEYL